MRRATGGEPREVIVPREILRLRQRTQRLFNVVTGHARGGRPPRPRRPPQGPAQSLVESTLLTVTGGVLGSVLGLVGAALIRAFAGWPTAVNPFMLVAALVVALGVGIGIGIGIGVGMYPAWHAAGLDPVEALRRE